MHILILQRIDTWNLDVNNSGNCASFDRESSRFQLTKCTKKLQYICKVRNYRYNSTSLYLCWILQIEISFPDSCLQPYYIDLEGKHKVPFYWQPWNPLPGVSKRTLPISSTAKESNREPGRQYYFKCDAKIYMGLMNGV